MVSPQHLILGTAGHIDHGKTSLIRRLTGVETDRLPEEKRRGITIVLGFAPLSLPSGRRVGVVDVPGHERFVKNMVAGAGGIDVALLVVAADEGVMPQTREHIEICQLLGVRVGVVALTKIDRAGELVELALEDVRAEVRGSFLAEAPIVPCSAHTGEGIDALLAALEAAVDRVPPRSPSSAVLLPVDRTFSMKGFGSIVTGTAIRGAIAVGDSVDVLPPVPGRAVIRGARVRGLQVFGEAVERVEAGQRAAVNLQGVELESLALGQALVTPGAAKPTKKLSVRLSHLASRGKKLKSGARALLHVGTALVEAGLTLLDADALEPGHSGYATLRLGEPIAALPGQRFILRGFETATQAGRTMGGGVILDPHPGRRRRRSAATLEVVGALWALADGGPEPSPADGRVERALTALVAERGAPGAPLEELGRRLGVSEAELRRAAARTRKDVALVGDRAVAVGAVERLAERLLAVVEAFHRELPFRGALAIQELSSRAGGQVPRPIVEHAVERLLAAQRLVADKEGVKTPAHRAAAETAEARVKVLGALEAAGLEPPLAGALEALSGLKGPAFKELLAALVRAGEVVNAGQGLYFARGPWEGAKAQLVAFAEVEGSISTAEAKTLFGVSRKFLIPLLEAFDKQQITVRIGEVRKVKPQRVR